MIFDNTNSSYLIDQGTGGTLTLNGNVYSPSTNTTTAGTSAIVDSGGNHTISAPVALATTTSVAITTGSVFTLSGSVSGTGGLMVGPLTLPNSEGAADGGGTLVLSGANYLQRRYGCLLRQAPYSADDSNDQRLAARRA